MTEYIIWGIPEGKTEEQVLFTKAATLWEAEQIKVIIEQRFKARNCRIQILDLSTPVDFAKILNI